MRRVLLLLTFFISACGTEYIYLTHEVFVDKEGEIVAALSDPIRVDRVQDNGRTTVILFRPYCNGSGDAYSQKFVLEPGQTQVVRDAQWITLLEADVTQQAVKLQCETLVEVKKGIFPRPKHRYERPIPEHLIHHTLHQD